MIDIELFAEINAVYDILKGTREYCSPWLRKKYQIINEKSFFNFPFIWTNFNSIKLNYNVPRLVEIGSSLFLS